MDRLQGSSARYPLGTDPLGRDFMSRLITDVRPPGRSRFGGVERVVDPSRASSDADD